MKQSAIFTAASLLLAEPASAAIPYGGSSPDFNIGQGPAAIPTSASQSSFSRETPASFAWNAPQQKRAASSLSQPTSAPVPSGSFATASISGMSSALLPTTTHSAPGTTLVPAAANSNHNNSSSSSSSRSGNPLNLSQRNGTASVNSSGRNSTINRDAHRNSTRGGSSSTSKSGASSTVSVAGSVGTVVAQNGTNAEKENGVAAAGRAPRLLGVVVQMVGVAGLFAVCL